jgi:putative hydrolase of the HAD superfamily
MTLNIDERSFIVFDLDDTLYKEVDFLKSAYRHIANLLKSEINTDVFLEMCDLYENGESVFDIIKERYNFDYSMSQLVFEYRYHTPKISLSEDRIRFIEKLQELNISLGIITDGRSKTQRAKLKALGIEDVFSKVLISQEFGTEKPSSKNFIYFEETFGKRHFVYIGDNIKKDFIAPNQLGWTTIGIKDDGQNIHSQDISVSKEHHPNHMAASFCEIKLKFSS